MLGPISGNPVLANRRPGRRAIAASGWALVFQGTQMNWLDASGAHPVRNLNMAYEAVTDASGNNAAYVETQVRKLHWIDSTDEDLGLSGTAPAMSTDGSFLIFLAPDGSLQLYQRATRAVRRLGSDGYLSFALGGTVIIAVATDGRLIRLDTVTGLTAVCLPPFPEVSGADAPLVDLTDCGPVCYSDPVYGLVLTSGMILVLRGNYLSQSGWHVSIGGLEVPVTTWGTPASRVETSL